MSSREPRIGSGGFRTEGGVYLPELFRPAGPADVHVPPDLLPDPRLLVVGRPPSFVDQIAVYATQEELGLEPTPFDVIVGALREIPFWPAMKALCRFQRDLWPVRTAPEGQGELLNRWFGGGTDFVRRAEALLALPGRVVFSEQQLFALQKLLILYGEDSDPDADLSDEEYLGLVIALVAVPGSVLSIPEFADLAESQSAPGVVHDDAWLRVFIGHGGFIGRGVIKHELARAHWLYSVEATTDEAKTVADYCAIDEWLLAEFGLSFIELQAIGFALWSGSQMGDPETTPVLIDPSYFAPTALADRAAQGLDALSADRDWYRQLFEQSVDDPRRLAFDVTPFLQRPALRFTDRRVMPIAPRALEGWLGASGAYYRLFDLARSRGDDERERFTRFNGYLVERYAMAVAQAAHPVPEARTLWVPQVIGETVYKTREGEAKTPDVAVDLGTDLVLIEVTGGRPTQKSIVDAEPESIRRDIEKLLEEKIKQLGDRIKDLRDGTAELPGVRMDQVKHIWPFVVNSEGLFQTPTLWSYLREVSSALVALDQPGVQPLTLLDLEDLERLMGLAFESRALIDVLRSKTQDAWRERELATWFQSEGNAFGSGESSFIGEVSQAAFDRLVETLLGDQSMEEYRAKVAARQASGVATDEAAH